uniref:Uncharacterized protein n=1 Tax=Magallana gigas TaxID=29159 RepID=A0A8W8J330_MAGGI
MDSKALAAICDENGMDVCCSGYIFNKTSGLCDKCPPGYTGYNCNYVCLYPYYGEDCFMKCECTAEMCDFVSGCNATSTTATSSHPLPSTIKDTILSCGE